MGSVSDQARDTASAEVLVGGGEMGALMRAHDWTAGPLGPVSRWPGSLRTAVSICLASRFPMLIWWGPDLVMLYNDAYRPMLGASKHPAALGQRGRDCWPEIWDVIGPMLQGVLARAEATWSDDQLLLLDRNGYVEECYFTFSYSPIRDETGGVGGVFTAVTETTARVLGERRLATLRELADRTARARTAEDACAAAIEALSTNLADVPLSLLYLLDAGGQAAQLAGVSGLEGAAPEALSRVDLVAADGPMARAALDRTAVFISDLATDLGRLPFKAENAPRSALILPVVQPGQERAMGFLVAGLSPRRAFDDDYRGFLELVAGQIGTAIVNARAYEEERRRAESLAELDRAKTTFFSNVSHEFRTPLTLLLGPLEEALAAPPSTPLERERAQLEGAYRNSLRLLRLVNTLLDFARIEAGRVEASYDPTDLAALTSELASAFRSAADRAGVRLLVDCPPLPEPVYVDHEMWEKIVLNLLSNAIKFTLDGEIVIALRAEDGRATLEVRDTGVGIPASELPHIFERFHRVRDARARTYEGTGIGLALVRELVALHGGTVGVESVEGAGTTFTVTLPLGTAHLPPDRIGAARSLASTAVGAAPYVEEARRWLPEAGPRDLAAEEPHPDEPVPPVYGEPADAAPAARILLADDNADMRAYVRRLLGERYTVETATDGAAALAAALARPPDLLLADVMMPGMDGFALLRALRADPRTRTLPVILLSARAGQEATDAGLEAGADDYLVKPFAASDLRARVQAHVALARLRQEARDALAAERDRLQAEVSARSRAEEELRASEERYRAIAETANEGIWLIDRNARTIFANARLAELLGTTVDDVMARTVLDFAFPEDLPLAGERIGQNLRGLSEEFDFRFRRADGTALEVLACTSPVRAGDGTIVGALGMFSDITERRRAEATLRQQAALLALAHDAIIVRAPDGGILSWNEGAAALYGWSAAEAVGQDTHTLLRTRVAASGDTGTETDVALAERGAWEGHLEHTRRDGTHVLVESRQALLRAADGAPEAILEINRDMAARQELEAALARLQALQDISDAALARLEQPVLLRRLLERIRVALKADNAAILLLDETGSTLSVHAALGPEEAQIGQMRVPVGRGVAGRIAATRQPLIAEDLRSLEPVNPLLREQMASLLGVPLLVEGRLIGVMHVDSATPRQFTDDDLRLLQLVADRVALALDNARLYRNALQARDEAEELARQLQSERDRLRQVLDTLPVGVVIVDAHGRVEVLNQVGRSIVGLDTRGQPLPVEGEESTEGYRIRRPDGTPYPPREVPLSRSLLLGEEIRGDQQIHLHASTGRETPLLVNSAPLRDAVGGIVGAVATFQDISTLRELERSRDEFISSAAHDLKNPLTAIRGQAQLAARRLARLSIPEATPVLDQLARIEESTAAMLGLITELEDLTRQQMGGAVELHREPTDLVALVRGCIQTLRTASGRTIHLEADVPELRATVDSARIGRVVANLLSNAHKYSPARGAIWVRVAVEAGAAGPEALIAVRDEGIGIPAVDLPHIFDRFRRAGNVVGHIAGTGIGLASARGIVEQHGGTITAESTEGVGSTFTVRLPLQAS